MSASRRRYRHLLDQLLEKAAIQGYLTTDDVFDLSAEPEDAETLSVLIVGLRQRNVEVLETEYVEDFPAAVFPQADLAEMEQFDTVGLYLKEMSRVPLLSAEEEFALASRVQEGRAAHKQLLCKSFEKHSLERRRLEALVQEGSLARDRLIKANTRLVVSVAKRFVGRGVPFLDLIQEGNLGLIKAVEKFDVRRGFRFSTYATWWIRQMISRALADQARTIRLPVHMNDRIRKLYRAMNDLEQRLGRVPTRQELAAEMGIDLRRVELILNSSSVPLSLDSPVGDDEDSDLGMFIEDRFSPSPVQVACETLLREKMNEVLDSLPPREALILRLRFGLNDGTEYTLEEVGQKFGLTRERIRQIEVQALRRLRHPVRARQLKEYLA
jgi:RNA polymerase primary sigma factor